MLVLCAPIALACNPPPAPLLDCKAPAKLCGGLRSIQQASCEQLQSEPFLVSVVLQMGLARHPRNESLYGPGMGKFMAPTRQGGLGQQPTQIASALMFLSKQQISTYVEARTVTELAALVERRRADAFLLDSTCARRWAFARAGRWAS